MNLELEDRNCVILGGSRGIGRSIAIGFAKEGANVAICARGEVADVAVFVASPRANWITGECISVDGSQHKGMR